MKSRDFPGDLRLSLVQPDEEIAKVEMEEHVGINGPSNFLRLGVVVIRKSGDEMTFWRTLDFPLNVVLVAMEREA